MELFTREGTQYKGTPQVDEKGRPYFLQQNKCSRCGGAGGADKWKHTGWTCFECGGNGQGAIVTVRLYTAEQLAKLNVVRDRRRAKVDAQRAEAAREREAKRAADRAHFLAEHQAYFTSVLEACGEGSIAAEIIATATKLAALSTGQREALDGMTAEARRKAATTFIGEVGERLEFAGTVQMVRSWKNNFGYSSTTYLVIVRTAQGTVKYMGSAYLAPEGEAVTFKATVEGHEVYNGERQTVVARPKLKAPGENNG